MILIAHNECLCNIFCDYSKRKTVTFDSGKTMAVVTCGASGHNIRSRPSLKAAVVGTLALGNTVTIQENVSFL